MQFALGTGDRARKARKQSFLSSEASLGLSSVESASLRMRRGTTGSRQLPSRQMDLP